LFTGSTGGTFIVIYNRDSAVDYNALFGALFYANAAFNAAKAAGFSYRCTYRVAVGTKGKDYLFILWDHPENPLRAFGYTDFTAGT
jgi:hypothetical protein